MSHATSYTVLLIEPDTSLRRLIALGLQYQGMRVVGVSSFAMLPRQSIVDSDLLVLDLDDGNRDDPSLLTSIQEHPYLSQLPMVVLAWDYMLPINQTAPLPLREYLAKPFDARLLHTTVNNLLQTSAAIQLPISRVLAPAPMPSASFSPLITAAGLLLTVIGLLLLQLLIAGLGALIMLVALLWWTLGKRPEEDQQAGELSRNCSPSFP